ncbi:ring-opening amidohydrolase [Sinomonas sp. ASV322]|uniref:ring-opening amidohydrolase n=1 Tax=Sinomonas sp. ASV322 TaxID=3041920 RepID=UPI0027DD0B2D|nr:ring-opening amidohydrolase [Sinomonas sp. ASV322]MDQ4504289.1 ring-opening amidohydrolase [Sinomonas sp. ASV322]
MAHNPEAVQLVAATLEHESDTSALGRLVADGRLRPDEICAVTGKTEGNSPGESSRAAAIAAVRGFLAEHGGLSDERIGAIPMVFSSGGVGILAPHVTIYTKRPWTGPVDREPRLTVGTAKSVRIMPEWVGHAEMIEAVADAVRAAARDANIEPAQAEYVLTKSRGLQAEDIEEARTRGIELSPFPKGLATPKTSGTTALGVAAAVDGLAIPPDEEIGTNLNLWTGKVSSSAGREDPEAQVILLGNSTRAGGHLRVGHAVMNDVLDISSFIRAAEAAGLADVCLTLTPEQRRRIVSVYVKIGTPVDARLRGRRQVHQEQNPGYMNELKAAVAGMFSAVLQDTVLYISSGAVHQGPAGGGTVAVIVDHSPDL